MESKPLLTPREKSLPPGAPFHSLGCSVSLPPGAPCHSRLFCFPPTRCPLSFTWLFCFPPTRCHSLVIHLAVLFPSHQVPLVIHLAVLFPSHQVPLVIHLAVLFPSHQVPQKFRYPFYNEILWYVLDRYLWNLTGRSYLQKPDIKDDPDERPDSPGSMQIDEDSRPPSRNPDSRPPSRSLDDSSDSKPKVEGEETPKLSKSITIELTRIDAGLKSSFAEGEYSKKLLKKCASDSSLLDREESGGEEREVGAVKSEEGGGESKVKKAAMLTKWEVDGLVKLVKYVDGLNTLPLSKRGVPKDMLEPEALLSEIKVRVIIIKK